MGPPSWRFVRKHILSRDITERPHAPSGVAAFMTANSKPPYITPSMEFSSGKGVVRGRRGAAAGILLAFLVLWAKKSNSGTTFVAYPRGRRPSV